MPLALQKQHADHELSCPINPRQCCCPSPFRQRPFPLVQCYSRQNQQQHMFPNPKVYQQPNHRYRHPPCPTEESGCKKSLKAKKKKKDTTGRMALTASSVGKNGWLITIDSTMETGGVEKNRTKSLKNGWKTWKNRGREKDGKQMNRKHFYTEINLFAASVKLASLL